MREIKSIYKVWTDEINKNKNHTVYLKYETEITTENKDKLEKNKAFVELVFNQENSNLFTNNLMIFQDKKYTVSIKTNKKLIIINGYTGDTYKNEKLKHFEFLKDSMYQQLRTQECNTISIDNHPYKKVILKATPHGMKIFNMKTVEFLMDEKQQMIKAMGVNYTKGYHLHSLKINILEQDFNYPTNTIKKNVLDNIFDKNGRLFSKYAGYKIIDNRK